MHLVYVSNGTEDSTWAFETSCFSGKITEANMISMFSNEAPMGEQNERSTLGIVNRITTTAETDLPADVVCSRCGLMKIERIQKEKPTQRILSVWGIHEISREVPFWILVKNFLKYFSYYISKCELLWVKVPRRHWAERTDWREEVKIDTKVDAIDTSSFKWWSSFHPRRMMI